MKKLTIIGGGPAALILAAHLDKNKYQVTVCEQKKALGRKFLVAGEGGLNLTYHSSIKELIAQYVPSQFIGPYINQFSNEDLINWFHSIGVPTFVGSSNRVFPNLDLKPIEVLSKIIENISNNGVVFRFERKWIGWSEEGHLRFEGGEDVKSDIVVFALGGASWKVTGSDGIWSDAFITNGVKVNPFRAANCAFGVDWDQNLITTHAGKPLKNIALSYKEYTAKGELVVSKFGLEGNAIYALSQKIQETLFTETSVVVHLDLKPTMTVEQIKVKYKSSHSTKITSILNKDLNLNRCSIALLKQFSDRATFMDPDRLVATIKSVPITLQSSDKIDKAISTLGGIDLGEIDENFQLRKTPNTYIIGEMLDWYAPTGGYLLQGCFSMGYALAKHLN